MTRAAYVIVYSLSDVNGTEAREYEIPCEGTDTMDKASYKAMTGGYKYFLRSAFMIGMSDDPEADIPEAQARPAYQAPKAAAPAAVKPAPASNSSLPEIYETVKKIKVKWAALIGAGWKPSEAVSGYYKTISTAPETLTVSYLTKFLGKLESVK